MEEYGLEGRTEKKERDGEREERKEKIRSAKKKERDSSEVRDAVSVVVLGKPSAP